MAPLNDRYSLGRRVDMKKVVCITGAVRNTGYAIARYYAVQGWNVCISSRDDASAHEAAARLKREFPDTEIVGIGMDQNHIDQIRTGFEIIDDRFGRLDAFVANAAHLGVNYDTFNMTAEMWDAVMNTNARGTFFCCQSAVGIMKRTGGSIVLISSVHANASIPGRVAYSASKGAINSMMRCMAVELGHLGIRVNSLVAGAIWTERWETQNEDETRRRRSQYPAGRESSPEDIAKAVYFLGSDQSPTITGAEIPIDSGISICLLPYDKNWNQPIS